MSNKLEHLQLKLEKLLGFWNMQEKLENEDSPSENISIHGKSVNNSKGGNINLKLDNNKAKEHMEIITVHS